MGEALSSSDSSTSAALEFDAAELARIVRRVAANCAFGYALGLVAERLSALEEKVRAAAGAAYLDGSRSVREAIACAGGEGA